MKLNKEELGLGAIFGISFFKLIGAAAVLPMFSCAALWAIGGSGKGRAFRFVGCPLVIYFFIFYLVGELHAALMCAAAGAWLTMGYGIPDPEWMKNRDDGSLLGRFFFKICRGDQFWSNIFTRAFYASVLSLPFSFIPGAVPSVPLTIVAGHVLCVVFLEGEIEV